MVAKPSRSRNDNRRECQRLPDLLSPATAAFVEHLALAHERDRHLRHGGEISACAHRPFLAHDRGDAAVEHLDLDFHDLAANSGMAPAMSVQA